MKIVIPLRVVLEVVALQLIEFLFAQIELLENGLVLLNLD